jgi:hypothetical protein
MVQVSYKLDNIGEPLVQSIHEYVQHHLDARMDAYLKKFTKKPDVKILLDVSITKNKHDLFEGSFRLSADGQMFVYKTDSDKPFQNPQDLVSHAFSHFKETLADG